MNKLVLVIGVVLLTSCGRTPAVNVQGPVVEKRKSIPSVVSLPQIDLVSIGPIAPKGRVQDNDYNDLPVVKNLIEHGKESIPYLISKLDDETIIDGHVLDYWSEVHVGDVALLILTDFFTDGSWQKTTIDGLGWDEFLERDKSDLSSEQVLRKYIANHGRKKIKERWQEIWTQDRDRLFWDESERCFKERSS